MSDLISRADAIEAVQKCIVESELLADWNKAMESAQDLLSALPSADAVPTVIRAKTFMRKEDFDKWAEDIKRQGENVICIPCDAEVVSADAEQEAVPTVVRVTMSDGSQYYLEHERDSIQADAEQGEWIEVEDYNGDVHYKCDQCGEEWTFPFGTPKENNANYCPMCGARMKGGAE